MFENQNVAFMVGLAFAVAASCNFPVLLMSVFWKLTTTRGALIGGLMGLISAVTLVVMSTAVWVRPSAVLGDPSPSTTRPFLHGDRIPRDLGLFEARRKQSRQGGGRIL